jgi:hypothetical protein
MSDVFISYKRQDEERVLVLRDALQSGGLDVWWDKQIPAGARWRERVLTELESAKCVVVVWSESSTGPAADFVRDEASRAHQRGTLLQIRIDDVPLPLGFGEVQSLDLVGWKGGGSDPRLEDLVAATKARIEGGPMAAPTVPRRRKSALPAAGRVALVLIAAGLVAATPISQEIVCEIPGIHAACGEIGLGGVPSRAEEAMWSKRPAGDCNALRAFLAAFPHGAYAAEGQTRLAASKLDEKERWVQEERSVPLFVSKTIGPFSSERSAQADALARGAEEARLACAGYSRGEFRLLSARAVQKEWSCIHRGPGFSCGFNGEAVCEVQALHADRIETCP